VISPLIALAAAVSGDARYMSPPLPMRPLKFRFAVERHTSPSQMTPVWAPRHGPQPGGAIMAPARTSRCMYPASIASSSIFLDAGITIVRVLNMESFTILAAAAMSSSLPLVQVPMKT